VAGFVSDPLRTTPVRRGRPAPLWEETPISQRLVPYRRDHDRTSGDPDLLAADYAELIRRQVGSIAAAVVLAHSGAGPLLPATARALDARHQVWLAAWVPDPEASFVEDTNRHAQAAFNPDWIGKDPTEDDAVAAAFLYHDADDTMLDWALSTRRLFLPLGVYGQRTGLRSSSPIPDRRRVP
jgi:hypothetical protein